MHSNAEMRNRYDEQTVSKLIWLRHAQLLLNEQLKVGKYGSVPVHLAIGREAVAIGLDK